MLHTISNREMEVAVLAGSRGLVVCSVKDLRHNREWLYSEDSIMSDRDEEKSFDEQYAGGMEFLFPGDEEELFDKRVYRDHGILWRMPFEVMNDKDSLKAYGEDEHRGIRADYIFALVDRELHMRISIVNKSPENIPYLIRLHPAFVLGAGSKLQMNAREMLYEKEMAYCSVPRGTVLDVRHPALWKDWDVFFHICQSKGEFTVEEGDRSLRVRYEQEKLPYLTVCSFWRNGRRIGIIEPANIPGVSLLSASERGPVPVCAPGQEVSCGFQIRLE